eukprot:761113-Hanusia_phi.AAC.6
MAERERMGIRESTMYLIANSAVDEDTMFHFRWSLCNLVRTSGSKQRGITKSFRCKTSSSNTRGPTASHPALHENHNMPHETLASPSLQLLPPPNGTHTSQGSMKATG